MFSILVILYFIQINLVFLQFSEFQKWREGFVKSVIVVFITVVLSTEFLSYFYLIKTNYVIGCWSLLNLGVFGYLFLNNKQTGNLVWEKLLKSYISRSSWFSGKYVKVIWISIFVTYFTVLFTAIMAPPNTIDVLTYHLARVAHWIQSGSVEFYPTSNERQLFNGPLSEYFILHLQILTGSDRFDNLVQFFSFLTSGVVVSLIAQKFKMDYFGQLLTCLISSSVPLAIIQASSSKNDLVVSLFVCCFFYYFLKALEENTSQNFIFAGLSLGLALLTKGNSLFFCLPIGFLISLKSLFQNRFTKTEFRFLLNTFGILLIAITVNFGHFYRNWNLYNTPFKGEPRLINEQITLPILFANAVRNYAIHIGTKFEVTKKFTEDSISDLLGDELNNPASTLETQKFSVSLSFQEEYAGNPLHIILLTFSFLFLFPLVFKKVEQTNLFIILSLSILLSFVFICAVLKWNPWLSRIHNPLFLLGSPLITFFLIKKLENILGLIISVFLISNFFTFYLATPRSLIPFDTECVYLTPRSQLYFSNCRNYEDFFIKATTFLKEKKLKEIGLDLSGSVNNYRWNDLEYPFFQFLKDDFTEPPLLRHVGVENSSKNLKPEEEMPEWVISTSERNVIENVEYIEIFKEQSAFAASPIRILQKK